MLASACILCSTLFITATVSWGLRWKGNLESLFEALYLDPPVFPTLESAKAFYRWCFWTALSRPDMVLNQSYRHPTAFFHVITFLIISSSACFLYELGYLCYTGNLYSSWDRAILELGYHWSRGGWRLAFPSHWAINQGAVPATLLPPLDSGTQPSLLLELSPTGDQSSDNTSKTPTNDPLQEKKPRDWYDVFTFVFNVAGLSGIYALQLWFDSKK